MTLIGSHPDARARRARAAFVELRGVANADKRRQEIDALPLVIWNGKRLHTLRCNGTRGKGPHDCAVPEALLWSLINLRAFRCPYHAGD